jgi:hypothetical protein
MEENAAKKAKLDETPSPSTPTPAEPTAPSTSTKHVSIKPASALKLNEIYRESADSKNSGRKTIKSILQDSKKPVDNTLYIRNIPIAPLIKPSTKISDLTSQRTATMSSLTSKIKIPIIQPAPSTSHAIISSIVTGHTVPIKPSSSRTIASTFAEAPVIHKKPHLDLSKSNEVSNEILNTRVFLQNALKEKEKETKKLFKTSISSCASGNSSAISTTNSTSTNGSSKTAGLSKVIKYSKRKSYFDVSERQKNRLKSQIKESILESTVFLRAMGLCIGSIELNPIEMDECDFKLKIKSPEDISTEKCEPSEYNLLYFKDKHSVSDKCYNDFKTRCFLQIPSIFAIKKTRGQIDAMFDLHDNEMGVFMKMEDKLKYRLETFFARKYGAEGTESSKFRDYIIHVKLGADGTNIGRNLKLLNFTFTIINEGAKAKTATGNYTLGIFEIENENYTSVSTCFKELIEEFEQLKTIKVNDKVLQVVYYYACDWKMLANTLGLQSANSKYPCVWCKCSKDVFYDMEKEWSITDTSLGARSHEEQAAILNHPDNKKIIKYGYEKKPIFKDIIPISRYMIDMLHLFLRISDTLFNLMIKDCSLADNFDMTAISKFDVSLYKHMNSLQHFLNEKCNVKVS